MTSLLADRLLSARRSRLVRREAECALFQAALVAEQLPFHLLYILGPGGVGKTTLLHEFAHLAMINQVPTCYLDGRHLEPTPDLFLLNLQKSLGLVAPEDPISHLHHQGSRFVLLIDTYEMLTQLDSWLREEFLPQLPETLLVVLASRTPPALEWRIDPGWSQELRVVPVRNLTTEESHLFLRQRAIPAAQHDAILAFTRGHPLALALVAEAFAQQPALHFQPLDAPDIIAPLLDRFIHDTPTPRHRAALEVCAIIRLTTESLLTTLLDLPETHDLFQWLRNLSFIESDWRGLFPHDLVRAAIVADLRWRNPSRYLELQQQARAYYATLMTSGDRQAQQQALADYLYLDRENPLVRPYFSWQESGAIFIDTLHEPEPKQRDEGQQPHHPLVPSRDQQAICTMIERHEGNVAARLAERWIAQQPAGVFLLRDALGIPQGVVILVALEQTTADERAFDPAVHAAWQHVTTNAPLQEGERAMLVRFWLAAEDYQAVSPLQSRIFLHLIQHALTTSALAYTIIPCADPAFWSGVFTYLHFARIPSADFTLQAKHYGCYGHDWRQRPVLNWLQMLGEENVPFSSTTAWSATPSGAGNSTPQPIVQLSDEEWTEAVRAALRSFHDLGSLAHNPLLTAGILPDPTLQQLSARAQAEALQRLLEESAHSLQQSQRNLKLYRALYHTYFQPAATQEQAAELLDLPFSTYRRHLTAAIAYLVKALRQTV